MNLRELDLQKRVVEVKYTKPLRAIFREMNKDAVALYKATGNIPAQSLAKNYTPEFTKIVRDAMRESIRKFGFIQRSKSEKSFDVEKQLAVFDYQISKKQVLFSSTDDELEKINNEFSAAAILFVATESDRQSLYIQDTNARELSKAQANAIILNAKKQQKIVELIDKLQSQVGVLSFQDVLRVDPKETARIAAISKRLAKLQDTLDDMRINSKNAIAVAIQENMEQKEESRAALIAEMAVGMAESWAREEEVLILAATMGLTLKKRWDGITDGHQRPSHFKATGQVVGLSEYFLVGGNRAKHPRDPALPISETAGCRCGVTYS